ncbi:NfeD family protein [Desulfococcaceae bacterium HSG9]|nr:NfeD family protein [Desulfococcaceae bacterium HSG9]
MKKGHKIGLIVDCVFVIALAVGFLIHINLGLILLIVGLFITLGGNAAPGDMFRESDIEDETDNSKKESPYINLIGSTGTAISDMRPQGTVEVDGQRINGKSSFGYIKVNSQVTVLEATLDAVVVEKNSKDINS